MDDFYTTTVKILRPKKVTATHGSATTLTYDITEGAQLIDVAKTVDLQPKARVESDDQTRVATGSHWRLHTQPGVDIDLRPADRVRVAGIGDLDVDGEVKRWPAATGIDHVEVELELRTG